MEPNYCEPYTKIQSYATLPGSGELLKKIVDYLLDMPAKGHTPFDSNDCPRARIARYLYWDCSLPLSQTLPTPAQKKQLIYDPENPTTPPDATRGYRVYPLIAITQAQKDAQSRLYIYMGRTVPSSVFRSEQAIAFRILCSTVYDTNTKESAWSRSYGIAQSILEALNGVNISGVGTFYFDRRQHGDCGMRPITDESMNVGYDLTMACTFMGNDPSQEPNTLG